MNKRGSHVGVVLSFMIFIIFIIFIYSLLSLEVRIEKEKQTSLDNLKVSFLENVSGDLIILNALNKSSHSSYDCLKIDKNDAEISELNCIVKNETEEIINSSFSGDFLKIKWGNSKFFKIHCSSEEFEEFSGNIGDNCALENIKSVIENDFIFQTKIYSLKKEYEQDYSSLKEKLGVSSVDEFGFNFEHDDGTVIGIKEEGISKSIYSERISIRYIDKNANIKNGFIDLKIW
jgi:hypothetical protein